ncbi:hypothetical protein G6F65_019512 [Rhizopus arrhizus]|nr:hypothetical protein G6F65_019512 [Rhizopus arrhizus]
MPLRPANTLQLDGHWRDWLRTLCRHCADEAGLPAETRQELQRVAAADDAWLDAQAHAVLERDDAPSLDAVAALLLPPHRPETAGRCAGAVPVVRHPAGGQRGAGTAALRLLPLSFVLAVCLPVALRARAVQPVRRRRQGHCLPRPGRCGRRQRRSRT